MPVHSHNDGVFKMARLLAGLLLVLAGCSTPSPPRGKPPPREWPEPPPPAPHPTPQPATPAPAQTAPPPAAPPVAVLPSDAPETTWRSLTRWTAQRGLGPPRCISLAPVTSYAIIAPTGVFTVQIGSRAALWEGVELRLGFAPQLIDGQVWMHSLDVKKNVEPALRGLAGVARRPRVIVLDPGHGGANPGARSVQGGWEKDFTLDLAMRMGRLLAAREWQVFLTRTNDVDVPLTNRVAFAAQHRADLFLSLHFNSSGGNGNGAEQAGLETYCLTPAGMPSTLTRGYDDDVRQVFPNNEFDVPNLQFALQIHRAALRATGAADRGVRRARFMTVLQGQRCPAVLIEAGYLSNPKEAQRIADWQFRQRLAEAIAEALK